MYRTLCSCRLWRRLDLPQLCQNNCLWIFSSQTTYQCAQSSISMVDTIIRFMWTDPSSPHKPSQTTAWFWYNLNLNGKIWLWNILPGCSEETNSCWRYRHWYRWYRRRQYSPLRAPYIPCTSQSSPRLFSLAKYYISSLRTLLLTKKPTKGGHALSLKVIQISRVKNRTWKPTRADRQQATWSNKDVKSSCLSKYWSQLEIAVNMSYFWMNQNFWCTGNRRMDTAV